MSLILNGTTGISDVDGTAAAPALTGTDTNTGIFFGADIIGFSEGGAEVARFNADAQFVAAAGTASLPVITTTGDVNTGIFFPAADTIAFAEGGVEAARFDASGNLLVGTTSTSSTSGNGLKVTSGSGTADSVSVVTGATTNAGLTTYQLYSTGASAYRFYVGAGGTVFATSATITAISDQRWKENIRDLDDGLEKVMALQPRKFDWKEGKGAGTKDACGFIAQEFETVFPDMIEEWKDPVPEGEEPYKAVNANLIPTLVKAIQEQQALITALTTRITALEAA